MNSLQTVPLQTDERLIEEAQGEVARMYGRIPLALPPDSEQAMAVKFLGQLWIAKKRESLIRLHVGALLHEFEEYELFCHVPVIGGDPGDYYATFDKWLRDCPFMSYSSDRAAMRAYYLFCVDLNIDEQFLAGVGVSKLTVDLPPVVGQIITKRDEQIDEIVERYKPLIADAPTTEERHTLRGERDQAMIAAGDQARAEVNGWLDAAATMTRPELQAARDDREHIRRYKTEIAWDDLPEDMKDKFEKDRPIYAMFTQE